MEEQKVKVFCITGTPGTGKTTLSRKIAKDKGYYYLDVTEFIKEGKIHEGYDRSSKAYIIDEDVLVRELRKFLGYLKQNLIKGVVIDSHMSHYLPASIVDKCIVTKCDLKVLNKRLIKRGYGRNKIRENLDAEIFNVCFEEAKKRKHKILLIDTSLGVRGMKFK